MTVPKDSQLLGYLLYYEVVEAFVHCRSDELPWTLRADVSIPVHLATPAAGLPRGRHVECRLWWRKNSSGAGSPSLFYEVEHCVPSLSYRHFQSRRLP